MEKIFPIFFNLKEIDNDAQTLLDKFLNNPEYGLFKKNERTPII